jgi:hypothetical protein
MASCRASSDGRFSSTMATDGSAASRRVPSPASTAESVWRFSRSTIPPRPLSSRRCHLRSATPPGISSGRTAASGHGAPPASTSSPGSAGTASPQPLRGSSGRSTLSTNSSPTIATGSVHSSPTARRLAGFRDAGAGTAASERRFAGAESRRDWRAARRASRGVLNELPWPTISGTDMGIASSPSATGVRPAGVPPALVVADEPEGDTQVSTRRREKLCVREAAVLKTPHRRDRTALGRTVRRSPAPPRAQTVLERACPS